MSIGRGSMERAAKAAERTEIPKKKPVRKKTAPAVEKAAVLEEEASGQIIYQKSSGMLERDAAPNEVFGLGDAMPVYYF